MQVLLIFALCALTFGRVHQRKIISVNYKPGQSLLTDVLDVNHTAWKSLGIDSQTEIDQHTATGLALYKSQYGLDFTNATYVPTFDGWALINQTTGQRYALLFPYKLTGNKTYLVEYDSDHPKRGKSQVWYRNHFGTLILMSGDGVFTSGKAAGTKWHDQYIIGYNVWFMLRDGSDITKPWNHERFIGYSEYPTIQSLNSQDFREPVTKQLCLDDQNRLCYDVTVADTQKDYITGTQFTVSTTTMLFPPPWLE